MNSLLKYFSSYKKLLFGTLLLGTITQVFALLDPQIFRRLIDVYVVRFDEYTRSEFMNGILLWVVGLISVALISRLAKTFQDYYVNIMTQKIGMGIYQDAIRHIFDLPYSTFEEQQSGQLLQKLQKARQDVQNFIRTLIVTIFVWVIGLLFVTIYAFTVHRTIGLMFSLPVPIMGVTFVVFGAT